jgi:NIMA (never in mitosis gene a)-related kinase
MQSEKIDCERILDYTKQLAEALQHMHEKRIIHRDLKPANILIFNDGAFKLSDLGLGRYMSNETIKAFSRVGTPLYMSPEVMLTIN